MSVENSILHVIQKQQGETKTALQLKAEELRQGNLLESLHAQLHDIYHSKVEKGYGAFQAADGAFQTLLTQWLQASLPFLDFSQQTAQLFKQAVEKEALAAGGHLFISFERKGMSDFLWVVILHQTRGLTIDAALELQAIEYLNLNNLHLAAKINLTEWRNNTQSDRYISFAKGKSAKKVTEYFKQFIGCVETANPETQTQELIESFESYCQQSDMDAAQVNHCSEKLYDYCKEQADTGDVVQMKEVASLFDAPDAFEDGEIIPHRRSLRKFVQLQGQMDGLSISFQRKMLGASVFFDADTGVLTLTEIPSQLRAQLLEMKS